MRFCQSEKLARRVRGVRLKLENRAIELERGLGLVRGGEEVES
jgi:hypothetical protein